MKKIFTSKAYLPGTGPKPEIKIHKSEVKLSLKNFQSHPSFIQAAELFNEAYYWEAHEVFEYLWREAKTESMERDALQILIKLCALQLKTKQQQPKAAEQLQLWVCQKIKVGFQGLTHIYGISTEDLSEKLLLLKKSNFSSQLNLHIPL